MFLLFQNLIRALKLSLRILVSLTILSHQWIVMAAPPQPIPVIPTNVLPSNGQVVAGAANIAQSNNTLNVNQTSQNAVINWGSFNVGSQAQVNFNQPNAQAATLNRVQGSDPSIINGAIRANGQVAIVNSNGIIFGRTAQVDAASIVASTLDVSDHEFMAGGNKTFRGRSNSQAKIINQGTLTAKGANAYVALLAPEVRNEGIIIAQAVNNPTVALASGSQITLSFSGNQLIKVNVDASVYNSLIENKRLIQAEGGTIVIAANAASNLLASVVKNSGVITASSITRGAGSIQLVGSNIEQSGQILANSTQGNAGSISLMGENIQVAAGSLTQALGNNQTGVVRISSINPSNARSMINIHGSVQASGAALVNIPDGLGADSIGISGVQNALNSAQIKHYLSQISLAELNQNAQLQVAEQASIQAPKIISLASTAVISGSFSTLVTPTVLRNTDSDMPYFQALPSNIENSQSSNPWIALFANDMIVNGRVNANGTVASSKPNNGRIELNVQHQLLLSATGQVIANGDDGGIVILRSENGTLKIQGLIQTNGSSGRGGTILAYAEQLTEIDGATLSANGLTQGGVIFIGIDKPNLANRAYLLANNRGEGSPQGPPLILSQHTVIENQSFLTAIASNPTLNNLDTSLDNFIEASGKTVQFGQFTVKATSPNGRGYFLIDPIDINIDSSMASGFESTINSGTSVTVTASNSITLAAPLIFNGAIYSIVSTPTFTLDISSGNDLSVININASITNTGINPINVNLHANGGSININSPINLNTSNVALYGSGSLLINNSILKGNNNDQLTVNHGVAVKANLTANNISIYGYRTDNTSSIGTSNPTTYRGVFIDNNVSITATGVNRTSQNKYMIQIVGASTDADALSLGHNAIYMSSGSSLNNNSTPTLIGNIHGIISLSAYTGNVYLASGSSINSVITAGEIEIVAIGSYAQIVAAGATINQASNKGIYIATSALGNLIVPNINNTGSTAATNYIVLAAGAYASAGMDIVGKGNVDASQVTSFTNTNGRLALFAGDPGTNSIDYKLGILGFGTALSPALNNNNTFFGQAYQIGNVAADSLIYQGNFNGNINLPAGSFASGNVAAMLRVKQSYNMSFTTDSLSKVYGTTDPDFSSLFPATGDIVINFGAINYTVSNAIFRSSLTGTRAAGENVGGYAYSFFSNLNLILNTPPLILNVTPAPLTISGTKIFDNTTTFDSTNLIVIGSITGENIVVASGSASTSSVNVGNYSPSTSGLGFSITGGAELLSNYSIPITASSSITKASITVAVLDDTKPYFTTSTTTNGIAYPSTGTTGLATQVSSGYTLSSSNYTGVLTGFLQKLDLQSPGAIKASDVGTYGITASNAVGNGLSNFDITYAAGSMNVTPISLVITAANDTKVYGTTITITKSQTYITSGSTSNATATSSSSAYTVTGLVNGHSVSQVNLNSDGGVVKAAVGYYAMTPSAAIGSGLSNYTISYVPATTGMLVIPAALTITAKDHTTTTGNAITYGSGLSLPITDFTTTGLVAGDSVTSVQINYNNQSPNVPVTTNVGTYTNSLFPSNAVGSGLSNYTITYVKGSVEVVKKTLTITASDQTTPYGPSWNLGYSEYTVTGLVNNDSVNRVTLNAAIGGSNFITAPAKTAVGEYVLTPSGASGAPTLSQNYNITFVPGKFIVTPAILTVTPKAVSREYNGANLDGSTNTIFSNNINNYSVTGLISGDTSPTLNLSGSMAFAGSTTQAVVNAGTYAYTQGTLNPSLTGTNANNYLVQFATGNSYVITPKQLSVTANKTYDGNATFIPSKITLSGLIGSETLNLTGSGAGNSPNVIGITSMSTSGLSLTNGTNGGLSSNYVLPTSTTLVSITPAPLSVSIVNNPTKTYDGGPVASLGPSNYLINGFIGSERATINQSTGLYNSSDVSAINGRDVTAILTAANYSATSGTGFITSNYSLPLSATGSGTITKATLTITANPSWKYVGQNDPSFTYSVSGGINGINPVTSADVIRFNADIHNEAGQYLNALIPANASGTGLSNYSITYVKNTFTILDINQVVMRSDSKSMTYGGSLPLAPQVYAEYCTAQPCTGSNVKAFNMASSTGNSTAIDYPTKWIGTDTSGGNGTITYDVGLLKNIAKSSSDNYKVGVYGYQVDPNPPTVAGEILNGQLKRTLITINEDTQASSTNNSYSGFHLSLGTLTVNHASITPTANTITKVYDGTVLATPSLSSSGTITNDVVTLNSPYSSYTSKNVANGTASYTSTGLYLSGTDAGNYILSATSVTNTVSSITKAPIVIAGLVAQNKVYDGTTAEPSITGASTSRLITPFKGDTLTLSTGSDTLNCSSGCTFDTQNVGTNKPVTVTPGLLQSTFTLGGADLGNYYISDVAVSLAANITPAPLYINGLTAQDKIYNGNTSAVITQGTLSVTGTIYLGDGVFTTSGTISGAGVFASKNVGTGIRVTPNLDGLSLSGTNASNYYIVGPTNPLTAAITPKPLTVTGITANNKVYDTNTLAYLTNGTLGLNGLVPGDSITVSGKATAGSFLDANVNNAITVTPDLNGLNLVGNTLGNYCIASVGACVGAGVDPALTANITRAAVTLSGTVQYNGSTNFTDFSNITIKGLAGQTLSASSGYAVMNNANVQIGKTFTNLSNLVLADGTTGIIGLASNYTFIGANVGIVNVTPAPITISTSNATKVFDGTTSTSGCSVCPSLTLSLGTLYTNVSNGNVQDTLASSGVTYTYDSRNVGSSNKSLNASGYTVNDGNNGANYTITFEANTTSTITPKLLTITPNNLVKSYATNDPVLTYGITGLVATDTVSSAISGSLLRAGTYAPGYSNGVAEEQVGTYAILQGSIAATNYTISFVTGKTLSINPYITPIVVTPADKTKVYGTNDPSLSYSVTGYVQNTMINHVLINDDPVSFLSGNLLRVGTSAPNKATSRASQNVGSYTIGQGTLLAQNYTISLASASLTITPAPLTVTANAHTKVYGDNDPSLTYGVSGVINRVVDGILIFDAGSTLVTGSLSRVAAENVGAYTINQGSLTNISSSFPGKNYSVATYNSNTFTITPAVLNVAVGDNAKFVYQADPSPLSSLTYSGFKFNDTVSNASGFIAPTLEREQGNQTGLYAIRATNGFATNYTFNYVYTNTPSTFNNCGLTNCSQFAIMGAGSIAVNLQPASYVYGTSSTNLVLATSSLSTPTAIYCASPCNSFGNLQTVALSWNPGTNQFSGAVTAASGQGESRFSLSLYSPTYDTSAYASRVVGQYLIAAKQVTVDTYKVDSTPLSSTTTDYPNTSNITFVDSALRQFKVVSNFLDITPLPISVSANNAVKVYDATALATTTQNTVMTTTPSPILVGSTTTLPFSDQITSLNYVYTDPNVGQANKVIQVSNLLMANGANNPLSNYAVTYVSNSTSTITPRPITVTADNQTKVFGSNDPSLSYTYTPTATGVGLAPGESMSQVISGALTRIKYGTIPGEIVGSYGITQGTMLANSNYALTYATGSLSITPYQGPITVAANPIDITYGQAVPALSYQVVSSGLGTSLNINGVQIDLNKYFHTGEISSTILPTDKSTSNHLKVGSYNITQGSLATSSFSSLIFIPSTIKVNPAPLYLNGLSAQSKNYDGTNTADVTGLVNLIGVLGSDVAKIFNPSFTTGYSFVSPFPGRSIPVSPNTAFTQLINGLGITGVDASNYYIAAFAFPLAADIRPLPDTGGLGLNALGGATSNSTYSGSGYNPQNTLMVAYTNIGGMAKTLFPDQKSFIGDTRIVPFDGSKPLQLGIKVGTAYESVNPVDYVVIKNFYGGLAEDNNSFNAQD
jgi:filamentous hemagglutinin family protein